MLRILKMQGKKVKIIFSQLAGFSVIGIIVSAISIGLLYLFIVILRLNIYLSYITAFFISIGISYLLNVNLVFKSVMNFKTYILYFGIYLSGMGLGLIFIALIRYMADFGDFINSLCAAPVTMTWNFLFIRYVFTAYAKAHSR